VLPLRHLYHSLPWFAMPPLRHSGNVFAMLMLSSWYCHHGIVIMALSSWHCRHGAIKLMLPSECHRVVVIK
jgi:hypothetical protein